MATRFGRIHTALAAVGLVFVFSVCRDSEPPSAPQVQELPPSPIVAPQLELAATTGPEILVGASDIAVCGSNNNDEATAKLLDVIPGTVFTAGDAAYSNGTATEYTTCFEPTWGRHKARIQPVPGDRDYNTTDAAGYFGYFGAAAGDPATGYYSYDRGDWHIVVLNTKLSTSVGSPQELWLKNDLQTTTKACVAAISHLPRYSSSTSSPRSSLKPIWDVLYKAGAEIFISGGYRNYERFAPMRTDNTIDPEYGIRQFVVGTGGGGTNSFGTRMVGSEVQGYNNFGVLKLTLDAASYGWEFVPVAGKTFTDAGTGTCHGPPPPVAVPGGPYSAEPEATIAFDGRLSSDPQGDLPLTYAWDFGDGSTGTGANPTHAYATDGVYTVTLTVTDSKGNESNPATATAVIENIAPTVRAGPDAIGRPGETITLSVEFTDPGNDAPWSYAVDWGDGTIDNGTAATKAERFSASHAYAVTGVFTAVVTVTDKDGGAGSDALTVAVRPVGTPETLLAAGDIATCKKVTDEATADILTANEGVVVTLGDNAYPDGRAIDYANCYTPSWGRVLDRTYASIGNHEYDAGSATPTYDYFVSGVGPRDKGYYSFDVGDWHIVVLNDNASYVPFSAGSAQDLWLQADLAANTKMCTLAIFHQPMFFSSNTAGWTVRSSRKTLWNRLYAAGADIVLNGHQHHYERFAPQDPNGVRDDVRGIRQWVVGTGGESKGLPTVAIAANSEVLAAPFGILKLTLNADSYSWEFIPIAGETFTDSGTGTCH